MKSHNAGSPEVKRSSALSKLFNTAVAKICEVVARDKCPQRFQTFDSAGAAPVPKTSEEASYIVENRGLADKCHASGDVEGSPNDKNVSSILDANVSLYPNAFAKTSSSLVSVSELLVNIRSGEYREEIEKLRHILATAGKADYKNSKTCLPAFSTSGTGTRKKLMEHNNLLQLDFDGIKATLSTARQKVCSDPYVAGAFTSPSGEGLKVILHIDGSRHQQSVTDARAYFLAQYGLDHDPSVKEQTRLCFVSYDPEAYENRAAERFPVQPLKESTKKGSPGPHDWKKQFKGNLATLDLLGIFKELEMLGKCINTDEGKFSVVCPWAHNQGSKGVNWTPDDTSTAILASSKRNSFSCLRSSCIDRELKDVVLYFEFTEPGIIERHCTHLQPEFAADALASEGVVSPWGEEGHVSDEELVRKYGVPFRISESEKGDVVTDFNHHYWAARFAVESLVFFEPILKQFYTYESTTGTWCWQTDENVRGEIAEFLLRYSRRLRIDLLDTLRTHQRMTSMVSMVRASAERRDPFRKQQLVIHLANGMLHLDCEPPELREFSPLYFSLNQCPVSFNPSADCPRFVGEVLMPALSADDINLLQIMVGMCLTGINTWQKVLILSGIGGSGKGLITRIIEGIIGKRNVKQLRTNLLESRFELDDIDSKTLLIGSDVSGDFLSTSGAMVIKSLTGGDTLTIEIKGGRKKEVHGDRNVLITCNSRLRVNLDADASAWRRRLLIIEFLIPPKKITPNLHEIILAEEASGVLNWAILGALISAERSKISAPFPITAAQQDRVDDLLGESDSERSYVIGRIEKDKGSSLTVEEIYSDYENYCSELGWAAVSKRSFEKSLGGLMMEFHRAAKRNDIAREKSTKRGFMGVRFAKP